jgi:hypothetical protein
MRLSILTVLVRHLPLEYEVKLKDVGQQERVGVSLSARAASGIEPNPVQANGA